MILNLHIELITRVNFHDQLLLITMPHALTPKKT